MGDWGMAIAGYHSRTPGVGDLYRDQVVASWNPKDPAVLAKLTMQPLPPLTGFTSGVSSGMSSGMPAIYMPFAQPGPIQIGSNMAYRAFVQPTSAYRAFGPTTIAYADFARKQPVKQRGRPLDLRLNVGLAGDARSLVVPKGIIERGVVKPAAVKAGGSPRGQKG
jgi:hypothetical protein